MTKKRAKNEPTKGDSLAQAYRNRAAMRRVYESSLFVKHDTPSELMQLRYWTPRDMDAWEVTS